MFFYWDSQSVTFPISVWTSALFSGGFTEASLDLTELTDRSVSLDNQAAILEYLEEVYPERPLLPADPLDRFKVREICEIIGSGIQPLQNLAVLKQFEEPQRREEWASRWIVKGFTGVWGYL